MIHVHGAPLVWTVVDDGERGMTRVCEAVVMTELTI
jgi:hypothetical protein